MADPIANVVVSMPSQLFTKPGEFSSVSNGNIFVGIPDSDPTVLGNQIQVYIDGESGGLTPVPQPLRTNSGGYPVYNGQIVKFVTVQNHSMSVQSASGVQLFYFANILKYNPDQLRAQLSAPNGDSLIGHGSTTVQAMLNDMAHKSGETFTGPVSVPSLKVMSTTGEVIIGNVPVGVPGAVWPTSDSLRDAVNVSRNLANTPLNCHAFSDKTLINGNSSGAGYGAFDSTVIIYGSDIQDHAHSFQDRVSFQGTNRLNNQYGYFSAPTISGPGTVGDRRGIFINDVAINGGGKLEQQTGVYLEDLKAATGINIAFQTRQTTGYAWYSPNAAKEYHKGAAGFGVDPVSLGINTPISFSGTSSTTVYGGLTTDANGAALVVTGDTPVNFVSNGVIRARIKNNASGQSAFTPGNDNLTPNGDALNRWSVFYAGTGTINTSDAREKTPVRKLTDAEIKTGLELADEIGTYSWLEMVSLKGDMARIHAGMTVQRAIEIFSKNGLNAMAYGAICYDKWDESIEFTPEVIDNSGAVVSESKSIVHPAGDRYSFRPEELTYIICGAIRANQKKIEERLSALESK